jgi:hypothetical protein
MGGAAALKVQASGNLARRWTYGAELLFVGKLLSRWCSKEVVL